MANYEIGRARLNMQGVREILNRDDVVDLLEEKVNAIADEANRLANSHGYGLRSKKPAYSPQVDRHHRIAAAHVWANAAGRLDLQENRTLTQAMDAGR